MHISSVDDIIALRESSEVECKKAGGRDGSGEMPKSAWETFSAFSNTDGGYIILGLEERLDGQFVLSAGIKNTAKVITDIVTTANNQRKISHTQLSEDDISISVIDGKSIIIIKVARASRLHRPVFIDGNPLTGTYIRKNDADCLCPSDKIRRMLAEQQIDGADQRILKGYTIDDLSLPSIVLYRNLLQARQPTHPFLEGNIPSFLRKLRAFRTDRDSGDEGLTVAGLLMFGTAETIRDEFPHFALDYQDRDDTRVDRWTDRLTTDGSWPGNLFEFYRLVWRRLSQDLRVPFKLIDGHRVDETPVHVALREALVNTIVHADYKCRASVLIVRRPDMFGFRNPGTMRVAIENAVRGGESDSRNPILQQMFLMIGAGERAGSGLPKIHKGWRDQHWRPPVMSERSSPSEQILLELRMEDLLPSATVESLREKFGETFEELSGDQRIVLVTAAIERTVTHARAMTLCDIHPSDMTRLLQGLVADGFLVRVGQGRGSLYHLMGTTLPDPDIAFGVSPLTSLADTAAISLKLGVESLNLGPQSLNLAAVQTTRSDPSTVPAVNDVPNVGRRIDGLEFVLIDDLKILDRSVRHELAAIAARVSRGRMQTAVLDEVLADICTGRYVSIKVLAALIGRAETYLRQNYLNRLVTSGRLRRAFPAKPNDPRQAYTAEGGAPETYRSSEH